MKMYFFEWDIFNFRFSESPPELLDSAPDPPQIIPNYPQLFFCFSPLFSIR